MTAPIINRTLNNGSTLEVCISTNSTYAYDVYVDKQRKESNHLGLATIDYYATTAKGAQDAHAFRSRGATHVLYGYIALYEGEADKLRAALTEAGKQLKSTVTIILSSRGWGDYSPCVWTGDITRPDAEILAECRKELESGHDVDNTGQSDAQILTAIHTARNEWQAAQQPQAHKPVQAEHGPGYCYNCESYCYGDCGHYAPAPTTATQKRDLDFALREQNYNINE